MKSPSDLPIGTRFGSWVTVSAPTQVNRGIATRPNERMWVVDCECDCGTKETRDVGALRRGETRKCRACHLANAKRAGWHLGYAARRSRMAKSA